ncbi:TolC family protein [Flavobacterium hibernum]|uniref:RND transporter n=1 Tax=Flavobacterium hibernum TaxID=37752 RepID=A0A0D0F1E4_9FLAO|nr:TolC family protein [Flavobacterium hibernum]KIO51847.1 RND transporter [Flavobacterium hibernum]OXA84277.1 RND transporter [Flavobacterium hibernum]STO18977.1 Outer membrane protein oprM precursor [Flavobacterium hibernum]
MNSFKKIIFITTVSGLIVSCSVQKYKQPALDIPETFRNDETVQKDSTSNIARISYKDFFKDPVLVDLIDKAVQNNYNMKVALKQIEFASLGYRQSKWGNVPTVSANVASANISRPSDNSLNGLSLGQFLGQKYIEDYSTSINISWEADIWGKIKGAKEESLNSLLQTQEAAKAVKTRLVSEVVTGYYNLLMLDKQLEITRSNLSFADSTLTILKKQQELGMITSLAVEQQGITKDQILKTIPAIEGSINMQENALSILTGVLPNRIERHAKLDQIEIPEMLASGYPSEILTLRPDVKSRELEVRKSIATIHVAKTSMYPALNITAQGGLNSFKSSNWFEIPGSLFGMAAGSIMQPILGGKQLKTRFEQSKISSEQAELNFKQTVLTAVAEVSDALVQIQKLEEQQIIAQALVTRTEHVVVNSLTLYKYNEANYLDVIVAQTNRLQSELELSAIKTQRLNAITTLYRSLGGGWQ